MTCSSPDAASDISGCGSTCRSAKMQAGDPIGVLQWGSVLMMAVLGHLLYSHLGYNPSDDNMMLAMSRRLLEGQVPHRDFILSRPLGTAMLAAPIVAIGGELTYWLSRFVPWLELSVTALLWTKLLAANFKSPMGPAVSLAYTLMGLMLAMHHFPAAIWYTVDGVFLCTVGLYCLLAERPALQWSGALLMGCAAVCKQNYLAFPLTAVALGIGPSRVATLALAVLPLSVYLSWIAAMGGWPDAVAQLLSHSDLMTYGVKNFLIWPWASAKGWLFGPIAAAASFLILRRTSWLPGEKLETTLRLAGLAAFVAPLAWAIARLWQGAFHAGSMLLFWHAVIASSAGIACGVLRVRFAVSALMLAWLSGVSIGWNHPAIGIAPLVTVLAGLLQVAMRHQVFQDHRSIRAAVAMGLLGLLAATAVAFHRARTRAIYFDAPAEQLTCRLDGTLPGGRWIYTNETTFRYVRELTELIADCRTARFVVVPDFPGYWAAAAATNPLPLDWCWLEDVKVPYTLARVTREMDQLKGEVTIYLARVDVFGLARGGDRRVRDDHPIVAYVRSNHELVEQHEFFDVYR